MKRVAAVLAGLLIAGTLISPAQAATVTLSSGHVDVLDVDYTAGTLVLSLNDATGSTEAERNPADVELRVPAAAKVTVPSGSGWSFLGTAGSTAWVLPQSSSSGLLYAGWNTLEVPAGVLQNNSVSVKLTSVTGSGSVSVYTVSGGTPAKLFDSSDGLPDALTVARNVHAHANWGFTQAGTYSVTFEVTGKLAATGATVSTGAKTYTFTVLP
ncbi:hypothetical protein Acy02nite_50290 [Actinoplanes cyaneus]|uniref:Surface-anchored protein n=1 Tax=Actinoplanes cyaneus TaxID=52696 RepID=A0A919M7B3_9ACTN|nr:choice-of-anchor M domain-containing protein [Actinoplanes cyaneus]MCW2141086.1 surface-anchored protein [Actinoplanes cyaneus]GID67148.1 hypothetical protein Acy02nite_50290 [Actinoplanes cyaneus]